jgi:hypothetical protein
VAHPKHEEVRARYQSRCGYCGVAENDSGGGLTVDHFHPTSRGGDESDDNLVYACFRCNLFKGDFSPDESDRKNDRRVLHPMRDDPNEHLRLDDRSGELEALTRSGQFHVTLLQLNRPALVQHRLRARMTRWLAERQQLLEDEVAVLTSTNTGLELHIARLERLLGHE